MGSSRQETPFLPNEMRLLSGALPSAQSGESVQSSPIEKLVEQLRFANPQGAARFLQTNPGVLGQIRLLSSLDDQFN